MFLRKQDYFAMCRIIPRHRSRCQGGKGRGAAGSAAGRGERERFAPSARLGVAIGLLGPEEVRPRMFANRMVNLCQHRLLQLWAELNRSCLKYPVGISLSE